MNAMAAAVPQPKVTPELVAAWRARLAALHDKLDANPRGEWAWLWRVRAQILAHLLKQYTGTADVSGIAREAGRAIATGESIAPYTLSSPTDAPTPPPEPVGLGPRKPFASALQRIAATNTERLEALQRERAEFDAQREQELAERRRLEAIRIEKARALIEAQLRELDQKRSEAGLHEEGLEQLKLLRESKRVEAESLEARQREAEERALARRLEAERETERQRSTTMTRQQAEEDWRRLQAAKEQHAGSTPARQATNELELPTERLMEIACAISDEEALKILVGENLDLSPTLREVLEGKKPM
jgi:hypothetical protein